MVPDVMAQGIVAAGHYLTELPTIPVGSLFDS